MPKNECLLTQLGKYTLNHTLGSGSFGVVKHAVDPEGNEYAVKIISVSHIHDAGLEKQLKREITVLRQLKHPNVVQLVEVLRNKKFVFLIMELVLGGDLFDLLASKHRLSEKEARDIFVQIL